VISAHAYHRRGIEEASVLRDYTCKFASTFTRTVTRPDSPAKYLLGSKRRAKRIKHLPLLSPYFDFGYTEITSIWGLFINKAKSVWL